MFIKPFKHLKGNKFQEKISGRFTKDSVNGRRVRTIFFFDFRLNT